MCIRDSPYTVEHDRDIEFLVDKADVDETNATASIQNIAQVFTRTQSAPEKDALFFSKVAATAKGLVGYHSESAAADFTKAAVFGKLKAMLAAGKLRRYKAKGGLIMYVTSAVMDALEQSPDFTRNIVVTQVADGGKGLETVSYTHLACVEKDAGDRPHQPGMRLVGPRRPSARDGKLRAAGAGI